MLCVKWMTIQFIEGISGRIGISEFDKGVSMRFQFDKVRVYMWRTYPWLSPVLSFHGIDTSSGLIAAPFRVNSFEIFDTSFSSFDLLMTGRPSTSSMWSKPSSRRTLYLEETVRLIFHMLLARSIGRTFLRCLKSRCLHLLHLRWPLCLLLDLTDFLISRSSTSQLDRHLPIILP